MKKREKRAQTLAETAVKLILKSENHPDYWLSVGVVSEVIHQAVEDEKKVLRKVLGNALKGIDA